MDTSRAAAPPRSPADTVLALALFVVTVLYLELQPHHLGTFDESYFLLEAKRILEGERLYTDIFWIAMPAAHWIMAGVFGTFGTAIVPARAAMAVVHGLAAAALFASARALGVRRSLATLPALAHVVLCQPPWPYASPHWFSALMLAWLLLAAVRRRWTDSRLHAFLLGLPLGGLAVIHQQKAVVMAAAVALLPVIEDLLARRARAADSRRALVWQWLCIAGGAALVVVPILLVLLTTVGTALLVDQLVRQPLVGYRAYNNSPWGGADIFVLAHVPYTVPWLLQYLPPCAAAAGALVAAHRWRAGAARSALGPLLHLLVLSAGAAVSIAYNPDLIHIAFIAGPFFVLAAVDLELGAATLAQRWSRGGWAGDVLAALLLALLAVKGVANHTRAWRTFRVPLDTAFGRIDFQFPWEPRLVEQVNRIVGDLPSRSLFAYPAYASIYLTTDTDNPTPHQLLLPGYNSAAQYREVFEILRTTPVPYVLVLPDLVKTDDPILPMLRELYVRDAPCGRGPAHCLIYRHRSLPQVR